MSDAFNCGHPKSEENSRPSGRGVRCRQCAISYSRDSWALGRNKHKPKAKDASCSGCGCAITANQSGMCRQCNFTKMSADPEVRRRRAQNTKNTIRRDPSKLEKARARLAKARTLRRAVDPDRMREIGAKGNASRTAEHRKASQVKRLATVLSWCPPHLRDDYLLFTVRHRFKAAEARKMIEDQHEMEMARWRRSVGQEVKAPTIAVNDLSAITCPVERAIACASSYFGIDRHDILSKSRLKPIVQSRAAVALVLRRSNMSYPKIAGSLTKADHTSAMHWVSIAEKREAEDDWYARGISEISSAWAMKPAFKERKAA